jgi:trimethylamine-N-oxide reductase (cytochrome c)
MKASETTGAKKEEKTFIKGIGFCSIDSDGHTSEIDVKGGKIIRIRPLHYDKKYKPEEFKPWKIEARGKTFEPTLKSLVSPLAELQKRIYSPIDSFSIKAGGFWPQW